MLNDARAVATLPCVDLDKMREFYGGRLGLKEMTFPDDESGQEAAAYQFAQGTALLIYARPTPTQADHTAVNLVVEDFEATIADLLNRGVQFEVYDLPDAQWDERGVATLGNLTTAWFKDPGGNILAVSPMPF